MYKNKRLAAIILMGGKGKRFKNSLPKQFHKIDSKEIYIYSFETIKNINIFDEIILVSDPKYFPKIKKTIKDKTIKLVKNGKTRQESSYLGLLACNKSTDIVLIHDAVRPFVSEETIKKNIEKAIKYNAVNTCINSFDTIIETEDEKTIKKIPKRSSLLRGQTPQTFKYSLILKAHKLAFKKNKTFTDDCSIMLENNLNENLNVHIIKGNIYNIKITTPIDMFLAEKIISDKKKISKIKNI